MPVADTSQHISGVAERYASSLFELSLEEGAVPAVTADLDRFQAMLDGSGDLKRFILSPAQTAELKSVLKSKLGREPRLDARVDPTLLGGLVVKVGSRMIDSSLRTKLAGIRAAMRGN